MIAEPTTQTTLEFVAILRANSIIPDVIPESSASTIKSPLRVIYNSDTVVSLGEEMSRETVQSVPEIEFPDADPEATYTLLMIDPDLFYQKDHLAGQVNHWYESGIQFHRETKRASAFKLPRLETDYVGPTPGAGTGKHRYTFLVAREPAGYTASNAAKELPKGAADLKSRIRFDTGKFLQEEGLTLEAVAFMKVGADLKSAVENVEMAAESVAKKIVGK
ncbi:hypothetical protein P7C70_g4606, partial [Phenoliferia sp. Uapishka_3]